MTNEDNGGTGASAPDIPTEKTPDPVAAQGWGRPEGQVPGAAHNGEVAPGKPGSKRSKKPWIITGCVVGIAALFAASFGITMLVLDDNDEPDPLLDSETWTDNQMMSEAIVAAGGSCEEFDYGDEGTSTCVNDGSESNYLFGFGETNSKSVRISVVLADLSDTKSLAWDDDWAVACIAGSSADAVADCQRLADAFDSPNGVEEIANGSISKDDMDDYDSSTGSSGYSDGSSTSGPATSFGDGTHMVGTDIEAGTYRSSGTTSCYWARLSGFSGTTDSILANANPDGQAIVTIEESDTAFQSQRCGTWTKVQ